MTDEKMTSDPEIFLGEKPATPSPATRPHRRAWIDKDGDIWQARKGAGQIESILDGQVRILDIQTVESSYGPLAELTSDHLSTAMIARENYLRQEFLNILVSAADGHAHPSVKEAFNQLAKDIADHWNP